MTVLHLPYTAWHLSYVAIGAATAPVMYHNRLIWLLIAFFCAVGIGAHVLDEFYGHPLATHLSDRVLIGAAVVSLAVAAAIGIAGAVMIGWWLLVLVAVGVGLVIAYNLELNGGWLHNDVGFAIAWGGFPALVGYVTNAQTLRWPGVAVVLACIAISVAQRSLSTPVRQLRRRTREVTGAQYLQDGTVTELSVTGLAMPLERALVAMSFAMVLLAVGLVAARW